MNDYVADSEDVPAFVRGVEAALRGLDSSSPLRALIYEQYLDHIASLSSLERRLVGLALLGSTEASSREMGELLMTRAVRRDESATGPSGEVLDLLVLTPKGPELRAAMSAFGVSGPPSSRLGEDCDLWRWEERGLHIGLAVIGTDGNAEAAIELTRIAMSISVRAAVLVGMAAGLEGEVKKGDLVIASWVVAYEFARVTTQKYISRAKPYQADMRSVQKVAQVLEAYPGWAADVAAEVRSNRQFAGIERGESEKLTAKWRPKVKTGVVLAGSRLIEDGSLRKLRDEVNDRALAAEMEGAGFAAACSALRVPWIVVRGVADYGGQDVVAGLKESEVKRGKSWQFPSTYVAAAFVRDMILSGRIPLLEGARRNPG